MVQPTLGFSLGPDLGIMRENPTLGFRLSMESAGHSFSPSAPATRVYSLSLK